MPNISVNLPGNYLQEMQQIKKSLSQYDYKAVASALAQYLPQHIVAGLVGCIIPESGSDHTILNAAEYRGEGKKGTAGWACGEGLIQWTLWPNKEKWIKLYNADSRSTQNLPTTWGEYSKGEPENRGGRLHAKQDGRHIAGSLSNQMLLLSIYYNDLIKKIQSEQNLAVIVAKIYMRKAGEGFYKNVSDPIEKAYKTADTYYHSSAGNHYLQSVKCAQEYMNCPVAGGSYSSGGGMSYGGTTFSAVGGKNVVTTGKAFAANTDTVEAQSIRSMNRNVPTDSYGVTMGMHLTQQ